MRVDLPDDLLSCQAMRTSPLGSPASSRLGRALTDGMLTRRREDGTETKPHRRDSRWETGLVTVRNNDEMVAYALEIDTALLAFVPEPLADFRALGADEGLIVEAL